MPSESRPTVELRLVLDTVLVRRLLLLLGALALVAVPGWMLASSVDTPHLFTNGAVADAAQINENFASHEAAIDDNAARGLLQLKHSFTGDYIPAPGSIPWDDTIPQATEGTFVASVTLTPKHADSLLVIDAQVHGVERSNTADHFVAALFRDSGANALSAAIEENYGGFDVYGGLTTTLNLRHVVVAGSTSPTTFSLRAGVNGGPADINGGLGARRLGGALQSGLTVTEVRP